MKRSLLILVVTIPLAAIAAVLVINYVFLGVPLSKALAVDPRNTGVTARAHYGYYVDPTTLVFDLRSVAATNAPLDVFRVFLLYSAEMKDRRFERVELAHRGAVKFVVQGTYFQTLGQEYGLQNPVYTIRTFPENLYRPDGSPAFGRWTGGVLGVLREQFTDFSSFHTQWYIADLAGEPSNKPLEPPLPSGVAQR